MSSCILAYPNFADARSSLYVPSFSGGSWVAGLPLTNLQDGQLFLAARSTAVTTAATQFDVDLKTARSVRVIAIPRHTLTSAATVRVRASNVAGDFTSPTYDSGTVDVWPAALSEEDAIGITIGWTLVLAADSTASRYWRFEFDDTTNADGYVDLSRLVMAPAYQPTVNYAWGATLGWETASTRSVSDDRATIYNRQPNRRVVSLTLDEQAFDECLVQALELQRSCGTHTQLMVVIDPTDVAHLYRRSFLCTLQAPSPMQFLTYNSLSAPFVLREVL